VRKSSRIDDECASVAEIVIGRLAMVNVAGPACEYARPPDGVADWIPPEGVADRDSPAYYAGLPDNR
jgi:hypothetical protein